MSKGNAVALAGSTGGARIRSERVSVTATNVLAALTVPYLAGEFFQLVVNNVVHTPLGATPDFTVVGTTITWSAANAEYSLNTNYVVDAIYAY